MPTVSFTGLNKPNIQDAVIVSDTANDTAKAADAPQLPAIPSLPPQPATQSLAQPASDVGPAVEGLEGEWLSSDFRLPRLNLAQKTGDLIDDGFTVGHFVLARALDLGESVRMIVLNMAKQYQEDLPYGAAMGATYSKLSEVIAAGGSLEHGATRPFKQLAHIALLVEKPADVALDADTNALFSISLGGREWCPCKYTAQKTAYRPVAVVLASAAVQSLRATGLSSGVWRLSSVKQSNAKGTWYVPNLALESILSPEDTAVAASVLL